MDLYCNHEARVTIERDYHYIFTPHEFPGLPEANLHELTGDESFFAANTEIVPVKAMHKLLPVLGYRIGGLVYITDANHIEPSEMKKMKDADILVINALRKTKHFSHFCLPEALDIIAQLQPREAYITHVSHEMGFYAEVSKELPPHVHIAYDGLRIEISDQWPEIEWTVTSDTNALVSQFTGHWPQITSKFEIW